MADPAEAPGYQEGWNKALETVLNLCYEYDMLADTGLSRDIEDLINE